MQFPILVFSTFWTQVSSPKIIIVLVFVTEQVCLNFLRLWIVIANPYICYWNKEHQNKSIWRNILSWGENNVRTRSPTKLQSLGFSVFFQHGRIISTYPNVKIFFLKKKKKRKGKPLEPKKRDREKERSVAHSFKSRKHLECRNKTLWNIRGNRKESWLQKEWIHYAFIDRFILQASKN